MKANVISIFVFLLSLSCPSLFGQGILFSEYRIFLKAGEIRTLQVCNPTETTRSYLLSFTDKKMEDGGRLVDIPDSVNYPSSLKQQLRVFPKRMTLAPGECQEVQIQSKNTTPLAEGEYRSYLHFLPLISVTPEAKDTAALKGPTPAIIMRIGAAIPIFFRKNTHIEKVALDNVSLKKDSTGMHHLSLRINRAGSQSVYGTLQVNSKSKGETIMVAERPGNALYAETNWKELSIPLSIDSLDANPSGDIPFSILFINSEEDGKQETLTEWNGAL